jgi:serine/threonine protein kinase
MGTKKVRTSDVLHRLQQAEVLPAALLATIRRELSQSPASLSALKARLVAPDRLTEFQFQQAVHGGRLKLGPYVLRARLGRGGMGTVYRGWHPLLNRDAALKVLRQDIWAREDDSGSSVVRRFEREIEILARLRHPRIVQAYDAGRAGKELYLAMEFVDGIDLSRRVHEEGPLNLDSACLCATQLLETLQYAHEQGLVHRDVKPSNVMSAANDIKLLDLGLAGFYLDHVDQTQLTESGGVLGTPDFLAPEQARGAGQAGPLSDVYSVGATLYMLLTGEPPFPGGSVVEKILKHQSQAASPPGRLRREIPRQLDEIVLRMLQKDPQQRFPDAAAAAAALLPFTHDGVARITVEPVGPRDGHSESRRTVDSLHGARQSLPHVASRRVWQIVAAVGVLVAVAVLAFLFPSNSTETPASPAGSETAGSEQSYSAALAGTDTDDDASTPAEQRLGTAAIPYLVDAVFLEPTDGMLPVAIAWADWNDSQAPGSVVLLDINAGRHLAAMPTNGPVKSMALSPARHVLAAAGGDYNSTADGSVSLWDVRQPQQPRLLRTLPGHDRGTALVLWQSENRVLTFRSQEASTETPLLRIWDSEDGRLLDEPISGRQGAAAATLLTGGQSLLLARYPGSISLWSTTTWQQQWQSALDYDVVYDLCPIPNTSFTLIAAGNNDATSAAIYLLDSQSFELQQLQTLVSDPTDLWLMDDQGQIGWVNGAGERVRARLTLQGEAALTVGNSTSTGPGWYWFEKRQASGGPVIVGGSGQHLLVDWPGKPATLINAAAP